METDYKAIAHAMNHLIKTQDVLNNSFSPKKVARRFKKTSYEIVHLTSFCQHGKAPQDFYINAHNNLFRLNDINHILNQKSRPGLLVLDYCKTLSDDQRSTLFFSGFPMKTGVGSLLLSLWTDRDIGSSEIVQEIYRQLIRTPYKSRAEALQAAQVETLGKPRFHHPFFWSGFILIGDWL